MCTYEVQGGLEFFSFVLHACTFGALQSFRRRHREFALGSLIDPLRNLLCFASILN